MRLHHIGIAVRSVSKAVREYCLLLGAEVTDPVIYDPVQDARLCMMKTEDGMRLELVEGKPVEQYLLKKIRMYHICCVTRDLEAEIARMRHSGGYWCQSRNLPSFLAAAGWLFCTRESG